MDPTTKNVTGTVETVESANPNGEFEVILATDDLDRDDENLWADEWQTPLPEKLHFDTDHAFNKGQSVPLTAGSGIPQINEDGQVVVRGVFAGTEHGQLVRQLVNEGHVWQASAAFIEHKSAEGAVSRELLNATFTGVPANTKAVVTSSKAADSKKPYGNVTYADPKNGKYPIDTEEHVRAAWSYINMPKNAAKYSSSELSAIKGRIRSAMRRHNIEIGGDSKSLALALAGLVLKAFADTAGAPGAPSVYDDGYDEQSTADNNPDDEGEESAEAQAVHDAAVALGASCSNEEKTYHANVVSLHKKAADTADTAADAPVPPVTPADLAARARMRTFQLTNTFKEHDYG